MSDFSVSRRHFMAGAAATGACLLAGGPALAADKGLHPATVVRLDGALDKAMPTLKASGAVCGVWTADGVWTAARGTTAPGGITPATLGLYTRVGSVTKTMVGTLILQLVDEGLINLDAPVNQWFPSLPEGDKITVRMLGTMSSGIASYTFDEKFFNDYFGHPDKSWKPEQLVEMGFQGKRVFPPGQGFQYCNTNFVMLGIIVEKLRKKSLEVALQDHLWQPLGMKQSSYPSGTDLPQPFWNGFTHQGIGNEKVAADATHWSPTFGAGAGQAVSTLHDLALWARELGTGKLLRPETQAQRLQPNPHSTKDGVSYCFGTGVDHAWIGHAGTLPGYNTQIAYLPGKDITIVTMTNSDIVGENQVLPAVDLYHVLGVVLSPDNPPRH